MSLRNTNSDFVVEVDDLGCLICSYSIRWFWLYFVWFVWSVMILISSNSICDVGIWGCREQLWDEFDSKSMCKPAKNNEKKCKPTKKQQQKKSLAPHGGTIIFSRGWCYQPELKTPLIIHIFSPGLDISVAYPELKRVANRPSKDGFSSTDSITTDSYAYLIQQIYCAAIKGKNCPRTTKNFVIG